MEFLYKLIFLLAVIFCCKALHAQCPHDPLIAGDTLLCPETGGILTTQPADAYQWYRRIYGGSETVLLPGQISRTITIQSPEDVLYYYSVESTVNGCAERSPEKLVDGYVFLPPTVTHSGKYKFNGNTGKSEICPGDTMFLKFNLPYDTNIVWFKNGSAIPGEKNAVYAVTASGNYTVEGAPRICPDYIVPLGLTISAEIITCDPLGLIEEELPTDNIVLFPNPATDHITLYSDRNIHRVDIFSSAGLLVLSHQVNGQRVTVDISSLAEGIYYVEVFNEKKSNKYKLLR